MQVGADRRSAGCRSSWSLNPYMGCVHRCTFCYVRHFEQRADRPSDDRYGRSIRVKPNVAEVLRRELARPSWKHDEVALGTATDPYQPAEARFRLTRACVEELAASGTPLSIVTRGPLIVRDIDVLRGGGARSAGQRLRLPPHARRARLAHHRAWHGTACEPPASDPRARGCGHRGRGRNGADPARALRPARTARGSCDRGACSGSARHLGRASSTFARVSASTSSKRSPATGRSRWSTTRHSSEHARTSPRRSPTQSPIPPVARRRRRASRAVASRCARSRASSLSPSDGKDHPRPRRSIASWPTRSHASSPTTTRSSARGFASRCRARLESE